MSRRRRGMIPGVRRARAWMLGGCVSSGALAACSLVLSPDSLSGGQATGDDAASGGDHDGTGGDDANGGGGDEGTLPGDAGADALASAYAREVLADHPLAYWRLGEATTAGGARDQMGAHNGTFVGSPGLGVPGAITTDNDTAIRFDGGPSWIDVGIAQELAVTGTFTIEFWVDPDPVVAPDAATYLEKYIVSKISYGPQPLGYHVYTNTAGNLALDMCNGLKCPGPTIKAPARGTWTHVAIVASGLQVSWYLNGVLASAATVDGSAMQSTASFHIGSESTGTGPFLGALDEVALYDHALDATRVRAHVFASGR